MRKRNTKKNISEAADQTSVFKLIDAAEKGNVEEVLDLTNSNQYDSSALNNAMMVAVRNSHNDLVKALLPLCDCSTTGSQLLKIAVMNGQKDIVEILLPKCDAKANDSEALRVAASQGYAEIVKLLLPASDPKALNCQALKLAKANGDQEIIDILSGPCSSSMENNEKAPMPPSNKMPMTPPNKEPIANDNDIGESDDDSDDIGGDDTGDDTGDDIGNGDTGDGVDDDEEVCSLDIIKGMTAKLKEAIAQMRDEVSGELGDDEMNLGDEGDNTDIDAEQDPNDTSLPIDTAGDDTGDDEETQTK